MSARNSSTLIGIIGEYIAMHYLCRNKYQIVKKNLRCPYGEVDIIAVRLATIFFIEVKAWRACEYEDIGQAIDMRKRQRIIKSARYFLHSDRRFADHTPQFAILFVDMHTASCRYVRSAFEEENGT